VPQPEFIAVDHDRFHRVDRNIFVRRVVADCMTHACVQHADEGQPLARPRPLLEACCQYGADTDLAERDAILGHADQLRELLVPAARTAPWFTTDVQIDPDYPSGQHVRTAVFKRADGVDGCVFLAHDRRGCAIHRAALEGGWDLHQVKPHICRLFPMSYEEDAIVISDDYEDYDCADAPGAPSLYRVARDTLAAVFGPALVAALDAVEATVGPPGARPLTIGLPVRAS
jgi:Fe-S-cluster containining protein